MNDIQRRLTGIEIHKDDLLRRPALTREELEQQMDEYFAGGGTIEHVPEGYSRFNQKIMPHKEFAFNPGKNAKLAKTTPRYAGKKRPPGASGVKGIHKVKDQWRATHEGRSIGMFKDRNAAIEAQADYIKKQERAQ